MKNPLQIAWAFPVWFLGISSLFLAIDLYVYFSGTLWEDRVYKEMVHGIWEEHLVLESLVLNSSSATSFRSLFCPPSLYLYVLLNL